MTALNLMLTVVAVPCARCGSTADTVQLDREILGQRDAVCCAPLLSCWYCGNAAPDPFWLGKRPFCCRACAEGWAE